MWVIRVNFRDGSWYKGVCDRENVTEETAKKRLLLDFKEIHSSADIKERGGGLYHIWEEKR